MEIYLTNMKDNKYFLLFNFDKPILIEYFNKNQIKIEIDKIIENYHLNSTYILGKKWQLKYLIENEYKNDSYLIGITIHNPFEIEQVKEGLG